MADKCVRVARGLLLYGEQIRSGELSRKEFLKAIGNVSDGAFRQAGGSIGAKAKSNGPRFFDSREYDRPRFGSSAGLVVGVSLGQESLRAGLFDANGILYHPFQDEPCPGQLSAHPEEVLQRIANAVEVVLGQAFQNPVLMAEDRLPFMGVSVAWPCPVNRQKSPVGYALNPGWNRGNGLDGKVAKALRIEQRRSHALNDTAAAAIAIAHRISSSSAHLEQDSSRLAIALRLAGGVGGASIVVEKPEEDSGLGPSSGFAKSRLTGGVDHLAGEIGHAPVHKAVLEDVDRKRPKGLRKAEAHQCSCVGPNEPVPDHLEAYAAGAAVARRVDPRSEVGVVVQRVLNEPDTRVHKRALEDVGTLVGEMMTGPVAMLNPATITITGALALPPVKKALETRLSEAHCYGRPPEINLLPADEDKFIRAKGAALVVLRREVHRKIETILAGPSKTLPRKVRALTIPLDETTWEQR